MSDAPTSRRAGFRAAIERFLKERLDVRLGKLAPEDSKREALISQFEFETWIDSAARRAGQLQAVTHSLKPVHPDARGTSLFRPPDTLPLRPELGTGNLGAQFALDVVGNAAALDVYKFLKLDIEGKSLLDWMLAGDNALAEALSADVEQSKAWIDAFIGITRARGDNVASHTHAKQIFWLTGDDPADDDHYQLMAPLYATSLAHAVFQTISEDRFGEAGKLARQARRDKRNHDGVIREYPSLAVQKLGGTKPQNISQLNSERGGKNYLLGSLPPAWKSRAVREPWSVESVLPSFGSYGDTRDVLRGLRSFLGANPEPTMETRNRRDGYIDELIDGLVGFASQLQSALPPGWSRDPRCRLVEAETLWLDPGRATQVQTESDNEDFRTRWLAMDWPAEIGKRFGNWLNGKLDGKLPVGDVEQRHWTHELLADSEWAMHVDRDRRRIEEVARPQRGGP